MFLWDRFTFISVEDLGPDTQHEVTLEAEQFLISNGGSAVWIKDIVDKLGLSNDLGAFCPLSVVGIIFELGNETRITANILLEQISIGEWDTLTTALVGDCVCWSG